MIRNQVISVRVKVLGFLALFLFAGLIARLYHVQVTRNAELFAKAREQYTSISQTRGKRGEIYDLNGNLLVGNIPCCSIVADPSEAGTPEQCRKTALLLAKQLSMPVDDIYKELIDKTRERKEADGSVRTIPRRYALLAKEVPLPLANRIGRLLKKEKCKGIAIQNTTKRYYPNNELLANILGFTNIDHDRIVAVLGIEKFFNQVIEPSAFVYRYERSRDGIPLAVKEEKQALDGVNVYLTIQEQIQGIMEEELDKLMAEWRPRAAYAIMADPWTGNIMAIAQRPTFNPNERSTMNPDAWRNRITEDVFEPGSTMKPMAISGAIDAGIVTPNTRFDCEKGHWFFGGKILRDSHPLGNLTVAEIVQKSSNIGTAKIAIMMGNKKLYDTLKAFGFGEHTGIPLRPETRGILRPLKKWDTLSISRFPIGQGVACSPLQLVRAYCALANGGHLVPLRLVDRVGNPDTGVVINNPIAKTTSLYRNPATHKKMIDMMKKVTEEGGTAIKAGIPGFDVAGKTGTSQKFIGGQYSQNRFFATFVGFVPADNPRLVLLVTLDEPQNAHYGGTVAGPYFRNIAERTLRYLNVNPDEPPQPGVVKPIPAWLKKRQAAQAAQASQPARPAQTRPNRSR